MVGSFSQVDETVPLIIFMVSNPFLSRKKLSFCFDEKMSKFLYISVTVTFNGCSLLIPSDFLEEKFVSIMKIHRSSALLWSHLGFDKKKKNLVQDLIKTANLLFSQLDSAYVWTVCGRHFSAACAAVAGGGGLESTGGSGGAVQPVGSESTNIPEICELVSFLLDIVSIETYVETSSEHLPRFFRQCCRFKSF